MSRPPIIGKLPPPVAERPKCPGCSAPLKPYMHNNWSDKPGSIHIESREWKGAYHGYGHFCSLGCTSAYANKMFENYGTRYIRKGKVK